MLQLTNSSLKVAKMSKFYLAHLDEEYGAQVAHEDELERVRKERQRQHLRRSQSTNIVGRAAYAVLDLFQKEDIAS